MKFPTIILLACSFYSIAFPQRVFSQNSNRQLEDFRVSFDHLDRDRIWTAQVKIPFETGGERSWIEYHFSNETFEVEAYCENARVIESRILGNEQFNFNTKRKEKLNVEAKQFDVSRFKDCEISSDFFIRFEIKDEDFPARPILEKISVKYVDSGLDNEAVVRRTELNFESKSKDLIQVQSALAQRSNDCGESNRWC